MARSKFLSELLSFLYVPRCLGCRELLSHSDGILCKMCRTRYDMLCHRKCRECGNDICECGCTKEGIAAHGVWRLSKLCAYVPKEKNNPFKAMLYSLKSKNNSDVREFFCTELVRQIKRKCPDYGEYVICYVPRSTASYKKYGYDHMQLLSQRVAEELGIGCERLFCRKNLSKVQKELDRRARFENAQKSILLCDGVSAEGKRYILLDDICVTGASLGRCATLLICDGAREVRCFVIGVRP